MNEDAMTRKSQDPSYDIFVSHSSKDKEFAMRLARDLTKAGFKVWLDQWQIQIGDSLANAVAEAIKASRFLLIIMSPDYFQSAWTAQEWQYSLAEEVSTSTIRLIPVLYRDCEIPVLLRSKQWVDFRDSGRYAPTLDRLVFDLRRLERRPALERAKTEPPKPGERIEQLDAKTVSDLKKVLQDAVEAFRAKPEISVASASRADLADIDEEMCFVIMPFGVESLSIVYEDFVKPTLNDRCKLRTERGDDVFGSNVIMDDITKSIRKARLIIADLTGRNPNVFYEVGIAHAIKKQVQLMTQSIDDVPFDLRHRRALVYEDSPRGCKKLEKNLYDNVQNMLAHPNAI
jgi:hypothetical protein